MQEEKNSKVIRVVERRKCSSLGSGSTMERFSDDLFTKYMGSYRVKLT
ncbi:hypothetical protein HanPI659440_Chr04g0160381 [Helianthus annuus]|nr:hypothetical protein HanPI659440_Chr04g0160381 [Helianthus annuus]